MSDDLVSTDVSLWRVFSVINRQSIIIYMSKYVCQLSITRNSIVMLSDLSFNLFDLFFLFSMRYIRYYIEKHSRMFTSVLLCPFRMYRIVDGVYLHDVFSFFSIFYCLRAVICYQEPAKRTR
jgi:hypothetical protein